MNLTEQKVRNENARNQIEKVVKENGIKWTFVADKLSMKLPNVTNWRKGLYMFGENRLDQVEALIRKYNNM